jgi:phage terminase large subunit
MAKEPELGGPNGLLSQWRRSPAQMVRDLFKVEPDDWQMEVLEAFPHKKRLAMKANKGPGKTTALAWLGWNFLLTRPNPNIAATSINGDNLKDGLWKEMSKWQGQAPLLQALFEWTTTRIFSKEKPADWWMSARTWPKSGNATAQADTLAGLHQDYTLFLLDEAGGIPDAVMASAEAVLASGIEGHIVIAGNPTHLSGPLYRACTTEKDLWYVVQITGDPDNPKRAKRVPIEWAREQIRKYGPDNPWVRVNVFGEFPQASLNALIGDDDVRAAQKRYYRPFEIGPLPKIMGVDVARQGNDMSVIARRQGPQIHNLNRYRNVENGLVGASIANRIWNEFDADACFVDATGGLGFTWLDQLSVLGKSGIPVQFSSTKMSSDRYANKRAEIFFLFTEWIKAGGAIPPEDSDGGRELREALINTTYTFKGDKLLLEDKDGIKAKIGFSPDEADACALTFAEPVTGKARQPRAVTARSAVGVGYSPFAELDRISGQLPSGPVSAYDPFAR